MAATDYNEQYRAYKKFKDEDPCAKYSERSTLEYLMGSIEGLTILDLGCGFGDHASWLAESGAHKVIGVDLSEEQIRLAKSLNRNRPNLEFATGNAENLLSLPLSELDFDVVLSSFVLTHLKTITSLEKVFRNVFQILKSDSRFIAIYPNAISDADVAAKYNLRTDFNPKKHWTGAHYINRVKNSDGTTFECSEMYVTQDVMRRCAEKAGFLEIQFYHPMISEEGRNVKNDEFWKEFLEIPMFQFFVCKKF